MEKETKPFDPDLFFKICEEYGVEFSTEYDQIMFEEEDGTIHSHPLFYDRQTEGDEVIMVNMNETKRCPICGKNYTGYPALSRKDNKTKICSECGLREALDAAGITGEEQDAIVAKVNETTPVA